MSDVPSDYDIKGFLRAKMMEMASTSRVMADIHLAVMKSVVRLCGKWDNKSLEDLSFKVQTHEENSRYCYAVALAIEDSAVSNAIFECIRTADLPTESTLEANRIVDQHRCSRTGKYVHYVDGKMVYRETGEIVPDEDRPQ